VELVIYMLAVLQQVELELLLAVAEAVQDLLALVIQMVHPQELLLAF
jgi:hypothetical protein